MTSNQTGGFPKIKVREVEKPPYLLDKSKLRRFDSKNTIFERVTQDPSWEGYMRMYDERVLNIVAEGKPGYSRVDFALAYASWTVHDAFKGGFSRKRIKPYRTPVDTIGVDWARMKYVVDDVREMSTYVKRAARLFGASLVGICKLNRKWLYADVDIPERFENVIVMAVEMDAAGIATSPAAPAAAATGVGYSNGFYTRMHGRIHPKSRV